MVTCESWASFSLNSLNLFWHIYLIKSLKVWGGEALSKICVFFATGSDSSRVRIGTRDGNSHISPPCEKWKDLLHQENSILLHVFLLLMWIPSSSDNTAMIAASMLNNPWAALRVTAISFSSLSSSEVFKCSSQQLLSVFVTTISTLIGFTMLTWSENASDCRVGKVDVPYFRSEISAAQLPDKVASFWVQKRKYFKHMRPCPHNIWHFKVILSTSDRICRQWQVHHKPTGGDITSKLSYIWKTFSGFS